MDNPFETLKVSGDRETLGRTVREVWMHWAAEQPRPKPTWLVPWDDLAEPDREVDRRIGEALFLLGYAAKTTDLAAHDAPCCGRCPCY